MIVDSSALISILEGESGSTRVLEALAAASPGALMSAASWVEAGIVADARSARHGERLDRVIEELGIEIVPVTTRQAEVARLAYQRFGRGPGSPARLTYGDCFSYALSTTEGRPLLYVGNDFSQTDVAPALRADWSP